MKRYIWTILALSFVLLIASSIYKEIQKDSKSARATRITCQKDVTAFERVYIQSDIKTMQEKLKNGNYELSSKVLKAVYSESKLFDYIQLEDMDNITKNILNSYIVKKTLDDKKLKISYYIYENDVNDPGKKTEKSKLYAGYVVFKFNDENSNLIYKVQIDFMDKKGADVAQSIDCAIKSFVTL